MAPWIELASSPFQQTYSLFVYLDFVKSNPESQVSVSQKGTQKRALMKSVAISTPAQKMCNAINGLPGRLLLIKLYSSRGYKNREWVGYQAKITTVMVLLY
jgi:hypothetical protein